MKYSLIVVLLLLLKLTAVTTNLTITNGPQNITVCVNTVAKCYCGFIGVSPIAVIPNWRIMLRSDNGNIINDDTLDGEDIFTGQIDGLQWSPDLTNGNNSVLLVGPVNKTHNQSSYQCIFIVVSEDGPTAVYSSVGTMTVVDLPSVIINVNEICITSINISLNTYSHSACGEVSHHVTISGNVIHPVTDGGTTYFIDELQNGTLYNITVAYMYNNVSETVYKSVRTSLPMPNYDNVSVVPNPIDVTSIKSEKTNNNDVRITWKLPKIDSCSMLAINHSEVQIYFSNQKIMSNITAPDYSLILPFKHFEDYSSTIVINLTVVDIMEQRSTTSTATVIINGTNYTVTETSKEESETSTNQTDETQCEVFIGLAVVFIVTSVIATIVIVILSWKLCNQKRTNGVDTIPPAHDQLQRQLNGDDIQMQPSPAYVSIDNKSPRLYQNI